MCWAARHVAAHRHKPHICRPHHTYADLITHCHAYADLITHMRTSSHTVTHMQTSTHICRPHHTLSRICWPHHTYADLITHMRTSSHAVMHSAYAIGFHLCKHKPAGNTKKAHIHTAGRLIFHMHKVHNTTLFDTVRDTPQHLQA